MEDAADLSQQSTTLGREPGHDNLDEIILDGAGQALFRLGRVFSRYPIHQLLEEETGRAVQISHILVTQVVAEVQTEAGREATIGTIAEKLVIDPSTASRLVAETIQAGYLTRSPSAADGRRIQLNLSEAGRELIGHALRYQRAVFEQVTHDWPEQDRLLFARLFIQFAQAVTEAYPTGK
jgi:DNA-binding MarR family transcriptional regulator